MIIKGHGARKLELRIRAGYYFRGMDRVEWIIQRTFVRAWTWLLAWL